MQHAVVTGLLFEDALACFTTNQHARICDGLSECAPAFQNPETSLTSWSVPMSGGNVAV